MTRKSVAPDSFQLLVNTSRKTTQVACCDNSKKSCSRQPPAFGRSPAKSSVSLRRYTPEKCLRPSASGCLFPPIARLPKWPAAKARKSTAPDSFQLLVNPFRKISPVARYDAPKKYGSRLPPALGQNPAKSSSSLRKCTSKKYSGQTVFGFWSILCKKPCQRSEMCPEKTLRSDSLRLLVDTLQKIPPAFGDVPQPFASGCRL